jgi:hypothetical protein
MTKTSGLPAPDAETIARWWVQLNCWVWPDDLPGKPNPPPIGPTEEELHMAIRGAHAVLDLIADEALVEAMWRDHDRRAALLTPSNT